MALLLYFFTEIYCKYIGFVQKDRFTFYCEIRKPSSLACKQIERKPFIVHHLWMTRLVDFSLHCFTLNEDVSNRKQNLPHSNAPQIKFECVLHGSHCDLIYC